MTDKQQKQKAFDAWRTQMEFLCKLIGDKFDDVPDTNDIEILYDFMINYNTRKAAELQKLRAELRGE
jgi:hypothetical protein